jgi:DNA transposition AAA+ family ATPase
MATQEEILNSNEAELILNAETFKSAIEELRNEYINLWLSSKEDDINKRENLHKAIKLLPEVERHLRIIVEKGKITKAQLGRLHKVV